MSKSLSAKYYQENKERLQKRLVKDIRIFLKKINLLSIEKKYYRMKKNKQKTLYYNYKKVF